MSKAGALLIFLLFAVFDRSGHNVQIEQQQLFNQLIGEWIIRVEETSAVSAKLPIPFNLSSKN
ncbi:hypothetical protein E0485_08840 [Paenibacillus albiflavus]|uniref:Uncharacterized protein n=1 Tax=Paenibacillus albiflavus TaxID=2545760 RepID=A0A4R4EEN9_9BACL|nr:hypothetical protein E0485_08840 [Paenibacillus albiflavus]